jgi:TRAP-type C4-dicarboxylate transport system permease small subunit
MESDNTTAIPEAGRIGALWAGLLLAPAAFLTNLELGYLFVYASCPAGSALSVHVVHAVCLLVALAGAAIAWQAWQTVGGAWPDQEGGKEGRTRFMAGLGLYTSLGFALTIVAQWIPTFALHPCQ